ncbi:MAG: DUF2249 domain-containing protein [Saprospiraceae bacterium]|nr:MAG: iron-sulfur cluster repair di-iron protein [Bacteroidetes bacterium OLB9]MCO6462983.1 DUF2249 domain-containing protein [Saprospiraceae bacterium]MCZ2336778.1 DUF2249 domain-containing protein [Chitinophagales bacterium]
MEQVVQPNGDLDVRVLVPIKRHNLLVTLFGDMRAGETFTFINDHDPIPLYYEFKSLYGDVVEWEYLNRGGRNWKVKVTKTEDSKPRDLGDVATLIDLRKTEEKDWKKVVFHRYSMMEEGTTMELLATEDPVMIHNIFAENYAGKHTWTYKKKGHGEYIVHITKDVMTGLGEDAYMVVNEFDVRPYPPTERHEMFYQAFADLRPGEAFEFVNDHDPKPLYYQMEAESKEPFRWEYIEKGPDVWKVRVIKDKDKDIADIF